MFQPVQALNPLFSWQGASGWWTPFSIIPLHQADDLRHCHFSTVYAFVRANADGSRTPLYFGETDDIGRRIAEHADGLLTLAWALGANEIHVHYLAKTETQRTAVERDLIHGNPTALNQRHNMLGGLFGLGYSFC